MTSLHRVNRRALVLACAAALCLAQTLSAQTPAPQPSPQQPVEQQPPPPQGQVLYQSHGEPGSPQTQPIPPQPQPANPAANEAAAPQLTDQDRAALTITAYDLDIRLTPVTAQLTARARLTLLNNSDAPLPRLALQISSSLTWQSATLQGAPGHAGTRLPLAQHLLDTDADHTGQASELILTLPTPLAPGATLTLDTFYTGAIQPSGGRLERLGATPAQALATDWDAIAPDATALRGFGNVLWFPVAAPQLFLSDGSLLPAIGRARLAHAATPIHLRLSIDYAGEPPTAAYFCGRRQPLVALHDNADAPIAFGSGIATANFPAEPIGIRPLSLFILAQPETLLAPLPTPDSSRAKPAQPSAISSSASSEPAPSSSVTGDTPMLALETSSNDTASNASATALAASAQHVAPLLEDWLGPHPLSALTILDHPGQPFEDGPLLVAPLASLAAPSAAPLLAHSFTHAWVQTGQPWMDEGLAEFFTLLWTEREKGRDAALAQLDQLMQPVAAAESAEATESTEPTAAATASSSQSNEFGEPLIAATGELFYRHKAAAVWWMLRDIAGEQPLQLALSAWRTQPPRHDSAESQAQAFEALLEKISGKDLAWFFDDWILHDRGLPTLSIVDVTPRQLPAGSGHDTGWLVAVTMRNQGGAAVEVPLTLRSGVSSITKRIRIPARSNVTDREVLASAPTEVVLNDGSVPETGPTTHTRTVVLHTE